MTSETLVPLVIGAVVLIFTGIYLFFSLVTVRHAARFRYLSKRTVWLSIFFVGMSGILLTLLWMAYGIFLLN